MTEATPNYLLLNLPDGKCPLRYARIGAQEPVIDLRSLVESMRMMWARWEPYLKAVCRAWQWPLKPSRDFQGRRTQLLWVSHLPALLSALMLNCEDLHPHARRRVRQVAEAWQAAWGKVDPANPCNESITPPGQPGPVGMAPQAVSASDADFALPPLRGKKVIRRELQKLAQELAAKGLSDVEIARVLVVSRPAASLLKRGIYKFRRASGAEGLAAYSVDYGSAHLPGVDCTTCEQMVAQVLHLANGQRRQFLHCRMSGIGVAPGMVCCHHSRQAGQ